MRIGIDARIVTYARGGIGNYVLRLIESLAEVDVESEYVVLRSRKEEKLAMPASNFRSVACWTPAHHPWERWTLGLEVARLGLDILHTTDFIPPAFGARRRVITVHDLSFLRMPEFLTPKSRRYYNEQIEWAVEQADHIVSDSEATKVDLQSLLGVPSERVTTVHLAADERFRPFSESTVRSTIDEYGLSPGYLLFVGTLEPRKNIPNLLVAYRRLLEQDVTDIPLVLVGRKGWLFEDIFERMEALSLGSHLRLLHDVPPDRLPAFYNGAALLILPSYYEGFGLPPLEAMACGTPVVVSRRASLPEVVGDAGVFVEPDDPVDIAQGIEQVLTDESLRDRLRGRGLARAASFTWRRTAEQTRAVYEAVLE